MKYSNLNKCWTEIRRIDTPGEECIAVVDHGYDTKGIQHSTIRTSFPINTRLAIDHQKDKLSIAPIK